MSKLITAVYEVNRQDKTPPSPHTHMHSTHAQLPSGTNSCSFILLRPIVPMESEAFISRPEVDSPLAKQFCCCMAAVAWECALDKDCQVPNIASIRHTCERGMGLDGPVDIFHSCAHMLEHGIVLFLCGSSNAPCSKVLTPTYTHTGCIPDHGGICGEKTGMCGAPPGCQGRRDRQWPQSMSI